MILTYFLYICYNRNIQKGKYMASEKFIIEYSEILRKEKIYKDEIKELVCGSMENQEKKKALILLLRKVNDLILDARKIFYDTRSSNRELEFAQSKKSFSDCMEIQNEVYNHLIDYETDEEMNLRYSLAIRENYILCNRMNKETIKHTENIK